jgi:hypothetical protein
MSSQSSLDAIARWDLPQVTGKPIQARRPGRTDTELEEIERRDL